MLMFLTRHTSAVYSFTLKYFWQTHPYVCAIVLWNARHCLVPFLVMLIKQKQQHQQNPLIPLWTLAFVPGDNSRGPRSSSHVSASLHHVRSIGGELSGNLHLSQRVATATASSTAAHERKHASGLSPVNGSRGVITSATAAFHTTAAYISYVSLVNVKKGAEKTVTTSTDWPEHVPMLGVCLLRLPNHTPTIVSLSVAA